jgi:hypothetical protein
MTTDPSHHVLAALPRRTFLVSAWPWRSLAYVLTGVPLAGVLAMGTGVLFLSWFAIFDALREGRPVTAAAVSVALVVGLVLAALSVPLSIPLAAVERHRLAIVDARTVPPARPRQQGWLSDGAIWRGWAYLLFLGTVVPAVYALLGLVVLLDIGLITAPLLPAQARPVTVSFIDISGGRSAIGSVAVGMLLLLLLPYLIGAVAAGQAALARALLCGGRPPRLAAISAISGLSMH